MAGIVAAVNLLNRKLFSGVAVAAVAAIALAGCAKSNTPSSTPTSGAADSITSMSGELKGSGASFPDAFYQEVIADLKTKAPNVKITYNPVGSGTGKKEFAGGLNDFAGSDSTVKPTDNVPDGSYIYVPTVAAPITVSFNLKGVTSLQLSPSTIGKIFGRTIKTWNDPAIAADNPGVTLPATAITVAHRSDASGTTSNFTKFLVAAAGTDWTLSSGDTVNWPTDTVGGAKNTGVATLIKQTDGTIGYVDLADAKAAGLVFASIKNKAGKFVAPTLDGAAAALAGAKVNDDLTYNPLWADGDAAYPITSPTYFLLKPKYDSPEKAKLVKAFVKYVLTEGASIAGDVNFATLPDSLKTKALAQLDKVS